MRRPDALRLMVVDDEHLFREALVALLGLAEDLTVVAEVADAESALVAAEAAPIDVAVIDLQLAGEDGITVATRLRERHPGLACLILTSHGRPGYLTRALQSGAAGFLPKTVSAQVLGEAVRTVAAGGRYVDPQLAAESIAAGPNPLTAREIEVLELAATGLSLGDVAARAALSTGTVRNYLSAAIAKVGGSNRYDAARLAADRGWLTRPL